MLHLVLAGVNHVVAFSWELGWRKNVQDVFTHMSGASIGVAEIFFHVISLFSSLANLNFFTWRLDSRGQKWKLQGLIDIGQGVTCCHLCCILPVKVSHRPAQIQGYVEMYSIFGSENVRAITGMWGSVHRHICRQSTLVTFCVFVGTLSFGRLNRSEANKVCVRLTEK